MDRCDRPLRGPKFVYKSPITMLVCDYHTHPQGHRVQPYTPELLQPWADSARKIGLSDIAFTDHDRYLAGIDFDEIDRLRDKNVDLKIRAGIELDNEDRKSTRLNSSHITISYAVFCLKKKI